MSSYGWVAVRAANLLSNHLTDTPREAWRMAAREAFPHSQSLQEKGCPRSAFLGLCEEGLVSSVSPGDYCRATKNKEYALRALELLRTEPELSAEPFELWMRVTESRYVQYNQQMEVVVALWVAGLVK